MTWKSVPLLRWLVIGALATVLALAPGVTDAQQMDDLGRRVSICSQEILFSTDSAWSWSHLYEIAACAGTTVQMVIAVGGDSFCYLGWTYFC